MHEWPEQAAAERQAELFEAMEVEVYDKTLKTVKDAIPEGNTTTVRKLSDRTGYTVGTVRRALLVLIDLGIVREIRLEKPMRSYGKGYTRITYRVNTITANDN